MMGYAAESNDGDGDAYAATLVAFHATAAMF
jgi:hypothetical protein